LAEFNVIRKLLPYTTAAVLISGLYVGWVFFSRWQASRESDRKAAESRAEEARRVIDAYGGSKVTVLNLSASRGTISRGETAQLCYGVSNAKTVRIDPPVGDIWPSMYRCIDVSPRSDTTYTITATDSQGQSDTKSINVRVTN
jgi:hypothetical protein